MDDFIFDMNEQDTVISPTTIANVTTCKNCNAVGGIGISVVPAWENDESTRVLIQVLCKLCGLDWEVIAENLKSAKIYLTEVIDLFDKEEE